MRSFATAPLIVFLLLCNAVGNAEDKSAGAARDKLKAAIDSTSMLGTGIRPWHWKMDVTLYDKDGSNPKPGGIEAWYADGKMRSVLTIDGSQLTTLRLGDKLYRSDGDAAKLIPIEIVFMHALNPIPDTLLDPSVRLTLSSPPLAKTKVDCVQPSFPRKADNLASLDGPLSYCFLKGTEQFVVSYQANQTVITRSRVGVFQSRQVPMALQIVSFGKLRAEAKTTALETFVPGSDDFALLPTLHQLDGSAEIPEDSYYLGLVLVQLLPDLSIGIQMTREDGSPRFSIFISTDGRVLSESLSNKADPDTARVVRHVISRWIYRPYLIDGLAVQVKTTVTMDFTHSTSITWIP